MRKSFTAALAMCGAMAAAAGSAQAEDTFRFNPAKYDLNRTEGAAAFEADLNKAASAWCRQQRPATGTRVPRTSECRAAIREAVMADLPSASREALARAGQARSSAELAQR